VGSNLKKVMANSLALEAELNKERAGALGAAGRRLEDQLAQCTALAGQLDQATGPARQALLGEYRAARSKANTYRWELCVQREAMGILRHDDVDRWYPEPRIITS
jgi:hypothetical protein